MKCLAMLYLFLGLVLPSMAASRIFGVYEGNVSLESIHFNDQFKASVEVVKTSETVTTAMITIRMDGTRYSQLLRFRDDGTVSGLVKLNGTKQAFLKGTWVRDGNRFLYRGKVRVIGFGGKSIKGSLYFRKGGKLSANGHLSGEESFRFTGSK